MAKNTSVILGEHFDGFINARVSEGRYGSASEVIRAGLRALEKEETQLDALRQALIEGEESGDSTRSLDDIFAAAQSKFSDRNG
jgi:antitoxin ParD1/3/4